MHVHADDKNLAILQRRTLRNAIASAPHWVTTRVSLVSRVRVKAKMMKNLMAPMSKNLVTSCWPWIGNIVWRIFVNLLGSFFWDSFKFTGTGGGDEGGTIEPPLGGVDATIWRMEEEKGDDDGFVDASFRPRLCLEVLDVVAAFVDVTKQSTDDDRNASWSIHHK